MILARLVAVLLAAPALPSFAMAEAPQPFRLAQTAEPAEPAEPGAQEPGEGTEEAAPAQEPAKAPGEEAPAAPSEEPVEGEESAPVEEGVAPEAAPAPEEAAPAPAEDAVPGEDEAAPPAPQAEPAPATPAESAPAAPAGEGTAAPADAPTPPAVTAGELPVIERDPARLPEPVRKTWTELVAAARSGDIERLRPLIQAQPEPPIFAFDDIEDPLSYLRSLSGDADGREILAILLEMLEAGYVHVDQGTPQDMYVWPYFARYPVDRLTPEQMVELFTLLTAGDYQDMRSYGAYIFFRVGIGPDGVWHFFVAGD